MMDRVIELLQAGESDKARAMLQTAGPFLRHSPEWHTNMAIAAEDMGYPDQAERGYRYVLRVWPGEITAACNLANLLGKQAKLDEAQELLGGVLARNPLDAYAHTAMAFVQIEALKIEEAVESFRRASELECTPANLSRYCSWSCHVTGGGDREAHEKWVREVGRFIRGIPPKLDWDGVRPLRVGFMGDTFREHPTMAVLEPLLARTAHVPVLYSDDPKRSDETTGRLKSRYEWHETAALSDEALAKKMRGDKLDALIDLQGHNRDRWRLAVPCRNPAPILLQYISYAGDTVVAENIDAQVGWTYRPADYAPPISSLAALTNGYVTFGSVHRPAKITRQVMQTWAAVLRAAPSSRLAVVVNGGEENHPARVRLESSGIDGQRLTLLPKTESREDYLRYADRFDICLDSFPYTGGATMLDMLWQGVPSVTIANHPYAMGGRILASAGLGEFVARDSADYVEIARRTAADLPRLGELRKSMRERMASIVEGTEAAGRLDQLLRDRAESVLKAQAAFVESQKGATTKPCDGCG